MRILLALVAVAALLSGCLDNGSAPQPAADDTAQPIDTVRQTQQLGRQSGSNVIPSRFDFQVVVPEGGATSVRWELTVQTSGNQVLDSVTGPGCNEGIPVNVNVQVVVLGSMTWGGSCDDLSAGSHDFAVVMNGPALAFEATVTGTVTQAL